MSTELSLSPRQKVNSPTALSLSLSPCKSVQKTHSLFLSRCLPGFSPRSENLSAHWSWMAGSLQWDRACSYRT